MLDNVKWIIGAGVALCLIFGGYKLYHFGWDAAMAKQTSDQKIAIEAAVEAARKEWQSTNQITSNGIANVNDTKQKLEVIVRQSPTIQAPLCTDVGRDYGRVYNQAIRAIKAGADTGRVVPNGQVPAEPSSGATGNR